MIEWKKPARGRQWTNAPKSLFRFSNQKGGGEGRTQCVIFIHADAMKKLRWVVGDKVVFAIDEMAVYLKRVPSEGFALSSATGGKRKDADGKMVSAQVKSSKSAFDFNGTIYANDFSIDGDIVKIPYQQNKAAA